MNNNQDNWAIMLLLKLGLVGWAVVMYAKTSEVLTALAPVTLFGQIGLSTLYGIGTAILIEGVAILLALLPSTHTNKAASIYAFILFLISGFCQFLDASLVKDVANQTATEQFFAFIALGIPPIGFGGLLMLFWAMTSNQTAKTRPTRNWQGLRPMWHEFINGSNGAKPPVANDPADAVEDEHEAAYNLRDER